MYLLCAVTKSICRTDATQTFGIAVSMRKRSCGARPLCAIASVLYYLASPEQREFPLPNVPLSPSQKQVKGTNTSRFALHLRNERDRTEIAVGPTPTLCNATSAAVSVGGRWGRAGRSLPFRIHNACSCDIPACHSSGCIPMSSFPHADSWEHRLLRVYTEHTAQ